MKMKNYYSNEGIKKSQTLSQRVAAINEYCCDSKAEYEKKMSKVICYVSAEKK